jgi:hypothetical protein
MCLVTGGRGSMPIWTCCVGGRLFLRKIALAPCTDGFAGQHRVGRDWCNKAGELSLSWMSIPEDSGGGRFAHEAVMIEQQSRALSPPGGRRPRGCGAAGASMRVLSRQLGKFARLCRHGAAAAAKRKRPVVVGSTFEVPDAAVTKRVHHLTSARGRTFVWASSWTGQRRLAVGTALDVTGHGVGRFEQISASWRECRNDALVAGTGRQPFLVGGFSFAPHAQGDVACSRRP